LFLFFAFTIDRYLPFGGGKRKCIGDQFALFESITALSMLVRRFDFKMAPGAPAVGMTTGATIHTTAGLHMTVTPRQLERAEDPGSAAPVETVAAKEMAMAFTQPPQEGMA
jgi:hypothetical protein